MLKVSLDNSEPKVEFKYPFIGITEAGTVVLFTAPKVGICIVTQTSKYPIGYLSKDWAMVIFKPLIGSVTLTNEE